MTDKQPTITTSNTSLARLARLRDRFSAVPAVRNVRNADLRHLTRRESNNDNNLTGDAATWVDVAAACVEATAITSSEREEFKVTSSREFKVVASQEFKVTSEEVNVTPGEFKVAPEELKVASEEFKVTSREFEVAPEEFKVTSLEFKETPLESTVTSDEFKVAAGEFKVTSLDQRVPPQPIIAKITPWMKVEELQDWLEPGDLVEIKRDFFEHWAVFVIRDWPTFHVVHLSGFSTDVSEKSPLHLVKASVGGNEIAEVLISPLESVTRGDLCRINNLRDAHYRPLSPNEVLTRALGEVGERRYNLLTTNCEHFATWCRYGSKSSNQTSAWKSVAAAVTVGALSSSATMGLIAGGAVYGACKVGNKIRHRMHRSRSVPWYLNI